jgi:hypothetical protein
MYLTRGVLLRCLASVLSGILFRRATEDSVARSKVRAGREAIARYARLGLDGASTSLSFAATDGTAKLILLLCRGSGDRVAKSRVEVATLSRSL